MTKLAPGVLAITKNMLRTASNGKLVKLIRPYAAGEILPNHGHAYETKGLGWVVESLGSPFHTDFDGLQIVRVIASHCLHPIGDNPGNEDFVTKARKTLPRAKPVTGPVTIDSRGEVVR